MTCHRLETGKANVVCYSNEVRSGSRRDLLPLLLLAGLDVCVGSEHRRIELQRLVAAADSAGPIRIGERAGPSAIKLAPCSSAASARAGSCSPPFAIIGKPGAARCASQSTSSLRSATLAAASRLR